jgi:hypothetical protein
MANQTMAFARARLTRARTSTQPFISLATASWRTRRLRWGRRPARATGNWDARPAKEGRGDLVSLALDLGAKEGQP